MSPADALSFFLPRYEAFEERVEDQLKEQKEDLDEVKQILAVVRKENELTRKTVDRFTNALVVGSISVVASAVAVIVFGPTP